jgi:hypothetical protein
LQSDHGRTKGPFHHINFTFFSDGVRKNDRRCRWICHTPQQLCTIKQPQPQPQQPQQQPLTMSTDDGGSDDDEDYDDEYNADNDGEKRFPIHDACEFGDIDALRVRSFHIGVASFSLILSKHP